MGFNLPILNRTRRKGGFDWYPGVLYQPGDILLWYDPSDLSTMFQDVAGTSPVTADDQSVLLMLDKGQWGGKTLEQVLAAQPELVTNGTFDTDTTGWTASNSTLSAVDGKLRVTNVGATNGIGYQSFPTTIGKTYKYTVTATAGTSSALPRIGTAIGGSQYGTGSLIFTATSATAFISMRNGTAVDGAYADYDNVSIKEIPGYHRVQATPSQAPKYKTDGTLHWLLYDGTDDGNVTPTINWGTDEVAICAGVTKSSDSGATPLFELSTSSSTNAGSFAVFAPYTNSTANYGFRSRGTAAADATATTYAAPTTNVLTGQGKIATDSATLRADGAQVGTSATDQGTGNFGNHILYFGRRGGSSLPFNGKEHQTVIRSRLLSASELAKLETFVAEKTGVIL
jgi:hypothetical protein